MAGRAESHSVGLGFERHTERGGVGGRVGLASLCAHGVAGWAKSHSVGLGSERTHSEAGDTTRFSGAPLQLLGFSPF